MVVLYLGDIYAQAGQQAVAELLPKLKADYKPDCIVAQAENVSQGRGISTKDMRSLQALGLNFFTGGNWTPFLPETHSLLIDPDEPIIGPANYAASPGPGYKFYQLGKVKLLFISLLGQTVGRPLGDVSNPLQAVDEILAATANTPVAATIVNFHGDFSSEKRSIGYYLDGRVSLVVGDHWHIQTADAMILPKGTAHISDVGMCGSLHSSLGVSLESIMPRWRDGLQTKNKPDNNRPWQLNALVVEINKALATRVETIREII